MTPDGVYFARAAENIFSGKGIRLISGEDFFNHLPFYPFLVGLTNILFHDIEFSAHFVAIAAFSLSVIPLFYLVSPIYSKSTAHWVSLLYITNGFLLIYSHLPLTEQTFTFLVILELLLIRCMTSKDKFSLVFGILLGVLGGLLYLTRSEGLLYYAAGAFSVLLLSPKPISFRIRSVFISLIIFLIFLLPYVYFIHQHTDQWRIHEQAPGNILQRQLHISQPGEYLELKKTFQGLTEDKMRLKLEELSAQSSVFKTLAGSHFALFRSVPFSMMWRLLELNKYLFAGIGFFFIGASFFQGAWDYRRKKDEFLLLLFLLPFVVNFMLVFEPKRFIPIFPILLIWVGNGIEVFRNWAKEAFNLKERKSLGAALSVCVFFAAFSGGYIQYSVSKNLLPWEYQKLGVWMKTHIPGIENQKVLAREPFVNFYSGSKIMKLPYVEKLEDLLFYMRHHQAKYFVVGEDLDLPMRDTYLSLLDDSASFPEDVSRRHIVQGRQKVILYEITP